MFKKLILKTIFFPKKILFNKLFFLNFFLIFLKNLFSIFIYFWLYVLFNQIFIDNFFIFSNIWISTGFIIGFALITFFLSYLSRTQINKHIRDCLAFSYKKIGLQISQLHPKDYQEKSSQEHLFFIYEIPSQLADFYFLPIYLLINDILKFLAILIMLFYFNWVIAIVIIFFSILIILFAHKFVSKMTDYDYKNIEINENNRYKLEFAFNNFMIFYYANKLDNWFEKLKNYFTENQENIFKNEKRITLIYLIYVSFLTFALFTPIIMGSMFLFFNLFLFDIPIFLIVISFSYTWVFNVVDISRTIPSIIYAKKIINENPIDFFERNLEKDLKYKKFQNLLIQNLSYNFDEKEIIKDLNLNIEYGKKIAIIGKNGSGKSTFLKLILGYYKNYSGEIKWDNLNLENLSNNDLMHNINFLDSKNHILNGTICENISLWDSKYDESKIKKIMSLVGLNDISLNYFIDFSNTTLSEGQIQRILIARLLYNEKPILIIDEGYNNIDKITTKKIREYFLNKHNQTYIEVSHHFSENELSKFNYVLEF